MTLPLLCPLCAAPLTGEPQLFRCTNRHTFDIAREGYVNLLLEQKAGRVLGDSKEMLRARRAFLEADFYKPLSDAVAQLAWTYLGETCDALILDVGCGEGYYLATLKQHLEYGEPEERCVYVGMDISKEAVRMAAKKYPDTLFIVADTWKPLLFADQSVRLLLNIFAPRNASEFARVSAPEGLLLVVIPRPEHLAELRDDLELLDIEENKEQRVVEQVAGAFELVTRQEVQFEMSLSSEALLHLVGMTPSARHTTGETWQALGDAAVRQVTGAFTLLLFMRGAHP